MQVIKYPIKSDWNSILKRPSEDNSDVLASVNEILETVKKDKDKALIDFALKFDKTEITNLQVTDKEILFANQNISIELKKAIDVAYQNIKKFHQNQISTEQKVETMPGVLCWRKSLPIDKVGLYIPGGTAPLFSTILMLAIPAQIAGCKNILLCTPPAKDGYIHPAILYTAQLCGVSKIFKVGGAQAIAAMAYGTETINQVYKIFGPGNQYVTAAKQIVSSKGIAIDMPAGPSEVAVIGDKTSNAAFIASDLLSQAEHGIDSQVILFTDDESLIVKVEKELTNQLNQLSRKEIATKALVNSKIILLKNQEDIIEIANQYAAEHLIISTDNALELAEKITQAGSVFIGHYTPESAGDYASGTNHTLPTNGFAKAFSGVSLDSFYKKITFQTITQQGLKNIGPSIEIMAAAEMLDAHKNAVSIRLKEILK